MANRIKPNGGPITIKMANNPPPAGNTMSVAKFTCFKALPEHLRRKIWKIAIDAIEPRILVCQTIDIAPVPMNEDENIPAGAVRFKGEIWIADHKREVPAPIRTNRESRNIALEIYKPILAPINRLGILYFRYDKDVLHVHGWSLVRRLLEAVDEKPVWRPEGKNSKSSIGKYSPSVRSSVRELRDNLENLIVSHPTKTEFNSPHAFLTPEFPQLQNITLEVPKRWGDIDTAKFKKSKHLVDWMEVQWNRAHKAKHAIGSTQSSPKFPVVTWIYPQEVKWMDSMSVVTTQYKHETYQAPPVGEIFRKPKVKPIVSGKSPLQKEVEAIEDLPSPVSPKSKPKGLLVETLRTEYNKAIRQAAIRAATPHTQRNVARKLEAAAAALPVK